MISIFQRHMLWLTYVWKEAEMNNNDERDRGDSSTLLPHLSNALSFSVCEASSVLCEGRLQQPLCRARSRVLACSTICWPWSWHIRSFVCMHTSNDQVAPKIVGTGSRDKIRRDRLCTRVLLLSMYTVLEELVPYDLSSWPELMKISRYKRP